MLRKRRNKMKYILKLISKCGQCDYYREAKDENSTDYCDHSALIGLEICIYDPNKMLHVCPLNEVREPDKHTN